ncbi:MAG: hypothetical protein MPJ50_16415 [Pirellulales bacterium]|nr:hypothetical protein [Pirellulales bacterium]
MPFSPDFSCLTAIAEASFVRAIGWLNGEHIYEEGPPQQDFVDKLHMLVLHAGESALALGWPESTDAHTCELCEDFSTSGNIGVPGSGVLYVAPAMILHYVIDHRYLPPEEFVAAVAECPLPGTPAYASAVACFPNSHPPKWD